MMSTFKSKNHVIREHSGSQSIVRRKKIIESRRRNTNMKEFGARDKRFQVHWGH